MLVTFAYQQYSKLLCRPEAITAFAEKVNMFCRNPDTSFAAALRGDAETQKLYVSPFGGDARQQKLYECHHSI